MLLGSQRVYIDQTAVDDALVDLIYQPSSAAPTSMPSWILCEVAVTSRELQCLCRQPIPLSVTGVQVLAC